MRSLKEISEEKTIIFISHRDKILEIADFVFNVAGGRVERQVG